MRSFYLGLLGIFFLCGFTSTFTTTTFHDIRDNNRYGSITIGDLQIMNTNLQYKTEFSYCYDDLDRYCNHFGNLFDFKTVNDKEGNIKDDICPKGWSLPSLENWEYLISGMKPTITRDKNGDLIYFISENYAQLQFGGFRSHEGAFYFNLGKEGHYMTSTTTDEGWATIRIKRQGKGYQLTVIKNTDESRAVSCRCVKIK